MDVVIYCILLVGKSKLYPFSLSLFISISLSLSRILSLFLSYRFIDNKKQEHGRRYIFLVPGHSILWQDGEYLCPLCQTFGNTVLPLATPLYFTVSHRAPARELSLNDVRDLIKATVVRGTEVTGVHDTGI